MKEYPDSLQLEKKYSVYPGRANFVESPEYGTVYINADAVPKPSYLPWIICMIVFLGEVFEGLEHRNYWWACFMAVGALSALDNLAHVYRDRKKLWNFIYADPS